MMPVLTVTLNPAVDLDSSAEEVRPGPKLRCALPRKDPGGGGINISRAMVELGGEARTLVAAGGPAGAELIGLLRRSGLNCQVLDAPGETRRSLSVTDRSSGKQFRFVFPGPEWAEADVSRVAAEIGADLPGGGIVVFSGSQPPGFPDDFVMQIVSRAKRLGAEVGLDSSGAVLRALKAKAISGLRFLRLDMGEAEDLLGHPLSSVSASAEAAAEMQAQGIAEMVILARGPEGSVLANSDGQWLAKAADVPVHSKTGAGDSFVAGFLVGLARGEDAPLCLQRGVAAASAAVMTPATELCRRADAEALISECPLTRL